MKKISELTIDEAIKDFLLDLNDMLIDGQSRGLKRHQLKVRLDCVIIRLEQILFRAKKGDKRK